MTFFRVLVATEKRNSCSSQEAIRLLLSLYLGFPGPADGSHKGEIVFAEFSDDLATADQIFDPSAIK